MIEFIKDNLLKALFNTMVSVIVSGFLIRCLFWKWIKNHLSYKESFWTFKYQINLLYKNSLDLNMNNSYDCFSLKCIKVENLLTGCNHYQDILKDIDIKAAKYNSLANESNVIFIKKGLNKIKIGNNIYYHFGDNHKPRPCFMIYESIIDLQESIKEKIDNLEKTKSILWIIQKTFDNLNLGGMGTKRKIRRKIFIREFKRSFIKLKKENKKKREFKKLLKKEFIKLNGC